MRNKKADELAKGSKKTVKKLSLMETVKSEEDFNKLTKGKAAKYKEDYRVKMNELMGDYFSGESIGDKVMEFSEKSKFIGDYAYEHTKNATWNINHELIIKSINRHAVDYGVLPTSLRLSEELGLSRNTITKHLQEYHKEHSEEEFERLKLLRDKGLMQMYSYGIRDNNMKAMGIFFNVVSKMEKLRADSVTTQNNFIQINNIRVEQDMLQGLSEDKLEQIMTIINSEVKTIKIEAKE